MRFSKLNLVLVAVVALFVMAVPAMAQGTGTRWDVGIGAGIGAGLVLIGAAYGISTIAGKAVESMARQPEVATNINGAMIVSAALIEGATFFALVVCLLVLVFE